MNDIAIVIQARIGSSRLPGKTMLPLGRGTTVIGYLLKSLVMYGYSYSQIFIATPRNNENKVLISHVKKLGFHCFQGPELNVLSRFQMVANDIDASTIVRLTGDNPLIDPSIIDCCIKKHFSNKSIVTSTRKINTDRSVTRYVPKGSSVDIFQKYALMRIEESNCNDFDREHVVPALFRENKVTLVKRKDLKKCGIGPDKIFALSIDTEDDYKLACEIVKSKRE